MSMYNFALASASSVGSQNPAAHVAASLLAAGEAVGNIKGTVAELGGRLAHMASTQFAQELAEVAANGAKFSYSQVDAGPDGMALTGDAVDRAAEAIRGA